jgi:hypothetical protein
MCCIHGMQQLQHANDVVVRSESQSRHTRGAFYSNRAAVMVCISAVQLFPACKSCGSGSRMYPCPAVPLLTCTALLLHESAHAGMDVAGHNGGSAAGQHNEVQAVGQIELCYALL